MTATTYNYNTENSLRVVLFVSRNKDNKDVPNFEQRKQKMLTDKSVEELEADFAAFVRAGVVGETGRFYMSVNARDNERVRHSMLLYLLEHPEQKMSHLNGRLVSLAAQKEAQAEKKWLFDFDEDATRLQEFLDDCLACDSRLSFETFSTPSGYAVVANRGFDTRKLDMQDKWKQVELKKDASLCVRWATRGQ